MESNQAHGPVAEAQCPQPHKERNKFHIKVDEEEVVAWSEGETAELTVKEVLDMSGNQPAEQYYLVEFTGAGHTNRKKYTDLNEQLNIKDHTRFSAVFQGCTPVS